MSIKSSLGLLATLASVATAVPAHSVVAARDVPRPNLGSVPYGTRITTCPGAGKIALTFDDGPAQFTEGIVNTLESNGVKATFFIVGANGNGGIVQSQYHSLLKSMFASGHHLASHSWDHLRFDNGVTRDQMKANLLQTEAAFVDVLGVIPTYFRPPYTECNGDCYSVLSELGYHVTDYNVDTQDWDENKNQKEEYLAGLNQQGASSYIVLAHDIQERTASNGFVQWMIDQARAKGLTFVTLGECLGDSPANWYRDPVTGGSWSDKPGPTTTPTTTPTSEPTSPPTSVPTSKPTSLPTSVPTSKPTSLPPKPTTTPPHYGNGTHTATSTSTSTYCPPEDSSTDKPQPTCDGKNCGGGGHPTKSHDTDKPKPTCDGSNCPKPTDKPKPTCDGSNCPKPTDKPYPTTSTTAKPPTGTGSNTTKPSSTKPPVVEVNAASGRGATAAHVLGASLFAALAWMVL